MAQEMMMMMMIIGQRISTRILTIGTLASENILCCCLISLSPYVLKMVTFDFDITNLYM